jgi:hypothetical protein
MTTFGSLNLGNIISWNIFFEFRASAVWQGIASTHFYTLSTATSMYSQFPDIGKGPM